MNQRCPRRHRAIRQHQWDSTHHLPTLQMSPTHDLQLCHHLLLLERDQGPRPDPPALTSCERMNHRILDVEPVHRQSWTQHHLLLSWFLLTFLRMQACRKTACFLVQGPLLTTFDPSCPTAAHRFSSTLVPSATSVGTNGQRQWPTQPRKPVGKQHTKRETPH